MNELEKKIMQNAALGVSALIGFFVAEKAYNTSVSTYMKLFHKDLWMKAVEELTKERG